MDSETLVSEQLEAGMEFLKRFEENTPVNAAFWLKSSNTGRFHFYIASDRISNQNFRAAYGEVHRVATELRNPHFDPFRVKLIWMTDPMVKSALAFYRMYPIKSPTRFYGTDFGGVMVDEVHLYPPSRVVGVNAGA